MRTLTFFSLMICCLSFSVAEARISLNCGGRNLTFEQMTIAGPQDDVFAGVVTYSAGGGAIDAGALLAQYPTCSTYANTAIYMNCGPQGGYQFSRVVIQGVELDSGYALGGIGVTADGNQFPLQHLLHSKTCSLSEQ